MAEPSLVPGSGLVTHRTVRGKAARLVVRIHGSEIGVDVTGLALRRRGHESILTRLLPRVAVLAVHGKVSATKGKPGRHVGSHHAGPVNEASGCVAPRAIGAQFSLVNVEVASKPPSGRGKSKDKVELVEGE